MSQSLERMDAVGADRLEAIISGNSPAADGFPDGIQIRVLVSRQVGARGICTARADFAPGAELPCHIHDCGEAVTVVDGQATVRVEGRSYELGVHDCVFVPAGLRHSVANRTDAPARLHTAFASEAPSRTYVSEDSSMSEASRGTEAVMRFSGSKGYELSANTEFHDLFAGRLGSKGICGGYGLFQPDAGLPCHMHDYDESITIVSGRAVCQVEGRRYSLSDMDTALVPQGRAHRFFNDTREPMAMIWVYAGDEPERAILDLKRCSGGA